MESYNFLAEFYDILTDDINYYQRAIYFDNLIKANGNSGKLLLDLACGTGKLSVQMDKLGYDVIGVDSSSEMLNIAFINKPESSNIQYVCQKMEQLDLFGTVDVVISALDSINHVTNSNSVQSIFNRVSMFLNPDGIFIFDLNTEYKQEYILANNSFVYDFDEVYCVWQNTYNKQSKTTDIDLDIFVNDHDNVYTRFEEHFQERVYTQTEIESFCNNSGLKIVSIFEGDNFNYPTGTSDRVVYITKKI